MQMPLRGAVIKKTSTPTRVPSHTADTGVNYTPRGICAVSPFSDDVYSSAATSQHPSTPASAKKIDRQQGRPSPSYQQPVRAASPYNTISTPTPERRVHKLRPQSPRSPSSRGGVAARDVVKDTEREMNGKDGSATPPPQHHLFSNPTLQSQPLVPGLSRGQITSTTSRTTGLTSSSHIGNTTPKKGSASSYSTPIKITTPISDYQYSPPRVVASAAPVMSSSKASRFSHSPHPGEKSRSPTPSSALNRTPSRGHSRLATTSTVATAAVMTTTTTTFGLIRPASLYLRGDNHKPLPASLEGGADQISKGGWKMEQIQGAKSAVTTPLRKKKSVTLIGKSPAGLKVSKTAKKITRSSNATTDLSNNLSNSLPTSTSASISCIRRVEDDDEVSVSTASSWGLGLGVGFQLSQSQSYSAGSSLWEGELQQMSLLDFEDNEEQYREEKRPEEQEEEEEKEECNGGPTRTYLLSTGTVNGCQPIFDLTVDMDMDMNVKTRERSTDFINIMEQSRIYADNEMSPRNCCLGDSFYLQNSLPYDASVLSKYTVDTITDGYGEVDAMCVGNIQMEDESHALFDHNDIVVTDCVDCDGEVSIRQSDNSMCSSSDSSTESASSTLQILRRLRAAGVDQSCFSPLDSIKSIDFSSPSFREESSCLIGHSPSFDQPLLLPTATGISTASANSFGRSIDFSVSPAIDAVYPSSCEDCSDNKGESQSVSRETIRSDCGSDSTNDTASELDRGFLCSSSCSGPGSMSAFNMSLNSIYPKEKEIQFLHPNGFTAHSDLSLNKSSSDSSFLPVSLCSSRVGAGIRNRMVLTDLQIPPIRNNNQNSSSNSAEVKISEENIFSDGGTTRSFPSSPISLNILGLSGPENALSPNLADRGSSSSLVTFSPPKGQTQRLDATARIVRTGDELAVDVVRPKVRVSKYPRSNPGSTFGERRTWDDPLFSAPSSSFLSVIPHGERRRDSVRSVSDHEDRSLSSSPGYVSMDSFAESEMGQRLLSSSASSVTTSLSFRCHSTSPVPPCSSCVTGLPPTLFNPPSSISVFFPANRFQTAQPLSQSIQDFLTAEAETRDQIQIEANESVQSEDVSSTFEYVLQSSQSTSCSTSVLNKVRNVQHTQKYQTPALIYSTVG